MRLESPGEGGVIAFFRDSFSRCQIFLYGHNIEKIAETSSVKGLLKSARARNFIIHEEILRAKPHNI